MKKTELTKRQLKYFNQENEEIQKNILKALSRKPIITKIKCGYDLWIHYVYEDGWLGYELCLKNHENEILFSGTLLYQDERFCDGSERKSEIISDCKEYLSERIGHEPKLMKKIFI